MEGLSTAKVLFLRGNQNHFGIQADGSVCIRKGVLAFQLYTLAATILV